jgi:NAD+ synthase (glutamine-hydrolysing)
VTDAKGRVLAAAPQFEEALLTVDLDLPAAKRKSKALSLPASTDAVRPTLPSAKAAPLLKEEEIYTALVIGTRDYLLKNGFQKAVIGLSGGIDSSLVACVAADALGTKNIVGVTLPSRFNAAETKADAEILAHNLGIAFHTLTIEPVVEKFLETLAPLFADKPRDIAEENLQARVRGVLLMALSNKFNWLVLTTGNKSEVSVGYSTLYGDAAGGFAVIKDIPKNLVYSLSRWRNEKAGKELIPQSVFDRPPTAELRPNQTDQDSLPPYDLLDRIVTLYVEKNRGLGELRKAGVDEPTAKKILRLIDLSEYKRRQFPPGVKITPRAFGRDRRMPITNRYKHG